MSGQRRVRYIDAERFEELVESHKNLVYTVCLKFAGNPFDADDLAQDTFVAAYKSFARFDGKNPKGWLVRIASNKCLDFLKKPARAVRLAEAGDLAHIADGADTVERQAERAAGDEWVRGMCLRLEEPYRSVALGYFCGEETITEMSRRTGTNAKTVATRLYRAKNLIKALMEGGKGI
jgi:RNA polymerase sigma-70 factor (ECF subfamily)